MRTTPQATTSEQWPKVTETRGLFLVIAQGNIVHREIGITTSGNLLNRIQYAHGWPSIRNLQDVKLRLTRRLVDYEL